MAQDQNTDTLEVLASGVIVSIVSYRILLLSDVSYRIGVEDVGFRLCILFLVNTESLNCINCFLLVLRFPVPAISHL